MLHLHHLHHWHWQISTAETYDIYLSQCRRKKYDIIQPSFTIRSTCK